MEKAATFNPFEIIDRRLTGIENLLLDLKHGQKSAPPTLESDVPLTIQEASKLIGKSVPTLYGYVHRRLIPHSRKGQKLYFFRDELLQWIESGRVRTVEDIKQAAAESLVK